MAGKKEIAKGKIKAEADLRAVRYSSFIDELMHDRSLWFIIYFAVLLAYLILNQGGSLDLFKAPQWAFRAFAFGGLLVFSILDPGRIRTGIGSVNLRGVLPIALALLLINANIVTIRPFETFEETMNYLAYASIAFLSYTYINNLKSLRQFIEIIIAAGFLFAFHGLFIFYGALWGRGETTPLGGLFYWHNPAAGFLLLIWPVALAQFYSLRRGWHTFLILYVFYIIFTAFGLTLSRGGWLAGFIPFFLVPFMLSRKKLMINWRPIALVVLYFLSAIPFILKYRGRFFQPIIDRWNQMRPDDYSVVGRLEFWDIAWRIFLKHPIFGIGFNTFGYYYVHYQTNPQYYTKDPHSLYLRFLVEGGVIGAAVIISILAIVWSLFVKVWREGPGKMLSVYRVGLIAGIIGELGHMALDFNETFPILPMLLLCQVAILARTFHFGKEEMELPIEKWEPASVVSNADNEMKNNVQKRGWFIKPLWIWQTVAVIFFFANIMGYVSMDLYEKGKTIINNRTNLAQEQAESQMGQLEKEAARSSTQEAPTFNQLADQAWAELGQQAKSYWEKSLIFNPWNWFALNDLLNGYFRHAERLADAGRYQEAVDEVNRAIGYSGRLMRITPHRPATWYYIGQAEILAGRLQHNDALREQGIEKLLHALQLDPQNIPSYYLGIAKYYGEEDDFENALKFLGLMEDKFVPRYANGDIDFGALRGKSLARQDWIEITETMREAWWVKADILMQLGRKEDAVTTLYNGLNTPVGGGEAMEEYIDLKMLQLPFALKIAEVAAELGDWTTVSIRANQAIEIMTDKDMLGIAESQKAHDLYYQAQSHLSGETGEAGSAAVPDE